MYLSARGTFIRNVATAVVNGAITLVLLLIAPLGLAAVITNTALVTASTFFVCTIADIVVVWLLQPGQSRFVSPGGRQTPLSRLEQLEEIERREQNQ